jgi:hypothetical protein
MLRQEFVAAALKVDPKGLSGKHRRETNDDEVVSKGRLSEEPIVLTGTYHSTWTYTCPTTGQKFSRPGPTKAQLEAGGWSVDCPSCGGPHHLRLGRQAD